MIEKKTTLEEAAEAYAEGPAYTWASTTAIEDAFIEGAVWQKERDEREASKDLEDEIHSFWNRCSEFQPPFATLEVKENGFAVIARHFANWQKEQMMKEAVEAEIGYVEGCDAHYLSVYDPDELEGIILSHFDVGDKVKIIIVEVE